MAVEGDRSLPKTPPAGGEYYVFRDAIHNLIEIENELEGRFLRAILGTRELQRLRRIKQNGLSALVYQTLEGSRFPHALGAYHIARKIIRHLRSIEPSNDEGFPDFFRINDRTEVAFPLAALLHDIGHGPLSHVWEELFSWSHEDVGLLLIKDTSTRLNRLLSRPSAVDRSFARFDGVIDEIVSFLENTHRLRFLFPLISGHLDVDRLDFMARDTRSAGVTYGFHDLEWIIRSLRFARMPARILADGTLGSSSWIVAVDGRKGLNTLIQFLRARENMYSLVYHHKTSRAAQCLLKKIFDRVADLIKSTARLSFPTPRLLDWFNGNRSHTLIAELADDDILVAVKLWSENEDKILAELCRKFLERDLYKVVEISPEVAAVLRTIDDAHHGQHLSTGIETALGASGLASLPADKRYWYEFDKTEFDIIGSPGKDQSPIWIIQFGRFGLEYTSLRKLWIERFGEQGLATEKHYIHCINVEVAEAVLSYVKRLPEFSAQEGQMTPVQVETFKPVKLISRSGATKEVYFGIDLRPGRSPRSLVAMKYYKDAPNVERDLEKPNIQLENADRRNITLASGYTNPTDPSQYVLVETCWNASIEALVKKDGLRRRLDEILDMGRQLFRGLSVLHNREIRHTDIKLDNCGYNYDRAERVYKIGDFGCMSISPEQMPSAALVGTKRTIAPERLAVAPQIGLGSDVWALGVTVYAACTGQYWFMPVSVPHAGEGRSANLENQLEELLAKVRGDVPAAVSAFHRQVAAQLPPLLSQLLGPCFTELQSRATASDIASKFEDAYQSLQSENIEERAKHISLWCQFEDLSTLADRDKMVELRESAKDHRDFIPPALWNL